ASGTDIQIRHKIEQRWHLVLRQQIAADPPDLFLEFLGLHVRAAVELHLENYVSNDERTGNRILSRSDGGHSHRWMAVDHPLYLLRMNLQSTHIDDPSPSAEKVIAIAPQLDDISRVHEALFVGKYRSFGSNIAAGGSRGPDTQREVVDFKFYVSATRP